MHKRGTGPRGRAAALALALLLAAGRAQASDAEWDWGFFASRLEDAGGDVRTRALGPLLERADSPDGGRLAAVRPVFCRARDGRGERRFSEIAWPLATTRRFLDERDTRVLLAYYKRFNVEETAGRYRFMIIPLYFQGRDKLGQNYRALFPLAGRIHEFLGQDEMAFFLFPLWSYSSINSVRTDNVLWPVYSRTKGKGISRFRVFPFYGYARHRARFEKGFVGWPFYTWARYTYPDAQGRGYIVFPLWGHFKMPDQEAWLFLPPLFRFSKGERMDYSYCPWPFFQRSRGQIERFYLWPLWGRRTMPGLRSSFFLWPVFRSERSDRGAVVRRRFWALPFVYAQVDRRRAAGDVPARTVARHHRLWPLCSYRQDETARRLRVLELWPLWDASPVERNWAPLWTLFSWTKIGQNADTEVLWGLARDRVRGAERRHVSLFPLWEWRRNDRPGGGREWNVGKGLIGRRRDEGGVTYRALWVLRWGGREKQP
ncbi:MAG TPA: hypothetical protein P5327_06420 [Kiritimatiellia bacterium]|nr:hypothetical protein [Kiritimatiellia bacterium]